MIKVSIIVPVYNVDKYLNKGLDSLINQTLREIEIICINDGSTDNSQQILEEYTKRDPRIIVINKRNEGQSIARNIGIDNATGEYIGFMDSDDWVDLDYFEKLYNNAKENNADIAAASIVRTNGFKSKPHIKISNSVIVSDFAQKLEICDIPDHSYVCNKIYKLDKLKEHKIKFEEGIIYEDVIFTPIVMHKLEKLITVPNINYYYLRRPNSTVQQRNKKANRDSVYAHQKAEEFFKEHNIDISKYSTITKRYKFLGFSIFKIRTKKDTTTYSLFNIIKFRKRKQKKDGY